MKCHSVDRLISGLSDSLASFLLVLFSVCLSVCSSICISVCFCTLITIFLSVGHIPLSVAQTSFTAPQYFNHCQPLNQRIKMRSNIKIVKNNWTWFPFWFHFNFNPSRLIEPNVTYNLDSGLSQWKLGSGLHRLIFPLSNNEANSAIAQPGKK